MIEGNVIVIGLPEFKAKMLRTTAGLADFRVPFKQSELYLEGRFVKTFERGGEPAWKPLSPMTMMLRRGRGAGIPLNDTGRLKATMTAGGRRGKRGSHRRIKPKRMEYGLSSQYKTAGYMQNGLMNPGIEITPKMQRYMAHKGIFLKTGERIRVPARPFMHFVSRDIPNIEKIFNRYIDALIV